MTTHHYFDAAPSGPTGQRSVELILPDLTLTLRTDRGVFSADRVDPGTKLLLQEAPPPPATGELLDLGCGYAPIAAALAMRSPGAHVWAVDVNQRALDLAAVNTAFATGVTVATPAEVPTTVDFAALYSNPPIRIGKAALHELLQAWVPRSEVAYLVVNKHLGADSLAQWMSSLGWDVRRMVSRIAYRLLQVTP
jgi:16S rRNA (guanine1207-N2)-methyltransferase